MSPRFPIFFFTTFLLAGCSSRSGNETILIGHIAPQSTPAGEQSNSEPGLSNRI